MTAEDLRWQGNVGMGDRIETFDNTNGVFISDEIRWDVDFSDDETNIFLATQKLSVEFELITGC